MLRSESLTYLLICSFVCTSFSQGNLTQAGDRATQRGHDAALTQDGRLIGRYVSANGTPLDGAMIRVQHKRQIIAETVTNTQGEFVFSGLQSTMYEIQTPTTLEVIRVWKHEIAPTSTKPLTLVSGDVVRGQDFSGPPLGRPS